MQPRGALFHEDSVLTAGIEMGWFFFGLWVLTALIVAAITSNMALRRGLPAVKWYFLGLLLHFIAIFLLWRQRPAGEVLLPAGWAKVPATAPPVHCAACGAEVHPAAQKCFRCGADLTPQIESEVRRAGSSK